MSNDSCALNADSSLKDAKDIVFYNNLDPIDTTPSARPSSSNPHPSKDAFSMLLQAGCKPVPDAENVYSSTGSMSQKCALSGTTELQLAQKKVVSSPLSDDSLDDSDAGNDTNPLESGTDQPGAEDEAEDEAEPECEDEVDDEAETTVQATLTKSEYGTSQGECAVLCPACPQPGKNLPDGWQTATKAKLWLYAVFLAIDANFRLKRQNVSSDQADPSLSKGWAYFIKEKDYKAFLAKHLNDAQEKSTCSSHNTVNMVDTKQSQGLAATGIGTVDCACHNFKWLNGVGGLQKGKKYLNMDYLFFSTLRGTQLKMLNVSYDIACQWHKHLWACMKSFPQSLGLDYLTKVICFFIPKFHLPVHVGKCQTVFLFNFTRFVGRTDGKAPERGWSNINPMASSMKAMGPGCRRDTLDNHFGDWNWKKTVGLGASLLHKMRDALTEKAAHEVAFEEFDAAITPQHRSAWLAEMKTWEENPNDTSIPNPLELVELEAEELQRGIDSSLHPEISPSMLIASGMDLEEEQRHLGNTAKSMGQHATDTQKGNLMQMWNSLCRRINMWRRTQVLYIPAIQSLIDHAAACESHENTESFDIIDLFTIVSIHLKRFIKVLKYMTSIQGGEEERRGEECQKGRARRSHAIHAYKMTNGNCATSAWTALKALATIIKKKDWQGRLQELADDHIKPLVDPFATGKGRCHISWIWMMDGVDCGNEGDDDADMLQGVQIEWCKSRARALQWLEEVELLREEMCRVLQFFAWQGAWWGGQGNGCIGELASHFRVLWAPFLLPEDLINAPPQLAEHSLLDLMIPNIP
ncbi:hypothetical protein F4604DRAFT_1685104 [Suillus subluteus]|nr:hypothetical protein F4604DRAFT_1685104 [Suillus subluteus]